MPGLLDLAGLETGAFFKDLPLDELSLAVDFLFTVGFALTPVSFVVFEEKIYYYNGGCL